MDLDELMDELRRLEGTHVGLSSALAIYVTGTLRVGVARSRDLSALPKGAGGVFLLTDELLESLPSEPTDLLKGFHVGSATVLLVPRFFVSAEFYENGIRIETEQESLSVITFQEGPPYTPQTIDLGRDS